jgi:hypothetical protein
MSFRITPLPKIKESRNAVNAAATARKLMYWKTFNARTNSDDAPALR